MTKVVRFDRYGDVDVLQVVRFDRPVPGPGQVLVRVKAAGVNPGESIAALVDTFGDGYVDLAIGLGVPPDRIDTITDWGAAARHGTRTDGSAAGARPDVLAELARLVDEGRLDVPIARTYPLTDVRDAYRELEARHTLGKIVLVP